MNPFIKVEQLSKAYHLKRSKTDALSREFEIWRAKIFRKEHPYSKVGCQSNEGIYWALKDLNFEIKEGERIAISGNNGAGKSTLLKILSKVTTPSEGVITGRGRIASLLEAGSCFHPELSGLQNIFLNGAMLGMSKNEIKLQLDEIIAFAEIEQHLKTPVKRYSSGMCMRLAFSVAAHLQAEIMILDEVLSVGDHNFQRKSIEKMLQVSEQNGKIILMVNHNEKTTDSFCSREIILTNGMIL
ncbi:MAG: ABC transporter ATP-binding protein [Pedobacter sp.]|nr:MAG: ABC transporter ATP-binding protein [Pedobacter sp.]